MNKVDITFINPPESTISIDGTDYTVRPITMRHLPALVRCVEPAFADLAELVLTPSLEGAVKVVGKNSELVCEAIAICTGTQRDKIEDMHPDRAAALLLICCEVNADFFFRAVPWMTAQAGRVAPLLHAKTRMLLQQPQDQTAIGGTPSSNSPAPDTVTATS